MHQKAKIPDATFKELFEQKIIREAIYIASPDLYFRLKQWEEGKVKEQKKIDRLRFSFLKYLNRMSTRCTPFGLFASCGIGEFSEKSSIALKPLEDYRKDLHLDNAFSAALSEKLAMSPEAKHELLYYPNSSLYKFPGQFRYVEYSLREDKREYSLQSVGRTGYLEKIVTSAKEGKRITILCKELVSEGFSEKDSLDFIESLVANQILVSEIQPTVTGENILDRINGNSILKNNSTFQEVIKNIRELKQSEKETRMPVEKYESIKKSLKNICRDSSIKHLFQIDLFSDAQCAYLNRNLKTSLQETLSVLNKITRYEPNPFLENFKNEFTKRYGQEEVGLTKVLDPDTGIGYGLKRSDSHTFLEDIHLPSSKNESEKISWSTFDDTLLSLVIDAVKSNRKKITLTKKHLSNLKGNWDDLPETLSSIVEIYKNKDSKKIYMNSAGGPSATNLLARFALGNKEINKHVENIIRTEEENNPGKIYAEIVHLPQVRTGNILRRPAFRKYEIPYLAKSNLPQEFQIPVQDLMVSVRDGKITLRSKKLKKEVIPRHTNAHNYKLDALPIYHFLCDLQTQNQRAAIGFHWNSLFKKFNFLPRVEFKNIILSKATWNFQAESLKELFQFKNENLLAEISALRKKLKLPRYAKFVESDNKLLIDFENLDSIGMFLNSIKNKKGVQLEEFLFDDEGIVTREGNRFCNQFVISFYRNQDFSG